jgi:sec-independent protein translocase protein TatB
MVIGVVALIVIGPEDLPDMFRQIGRFTAKLRQMSREFSRAMEQAAKETGVKDVVKDVKGLTSPKAMGLDAVKSAADKFEKWDPMKNAAKPTPSAAKPLIPAAIPATPAPAATPAATVATPSVTTPSVTTPAANEIDLDILGDGEALDDLADWEADLDGALPTPVHGAATQALYDKQAAKAAVIAEQTAKLKAIDDGTYQPSPPQPEPTILPPAQPSAPEPVATAPKKRVTKPKTVAAVALAEPVKAKAAAPKARTTKPKAKPDATASEPAQKPARKSSKKADPS